MKKINFENPNVRIKADIITAVLLTFFAFGMILHNALIPDNTVIMCDKNIDECKILYTNIIGFASIKENISFKISEIDNVEFLPRRGKYNILPANISISVNNIQNNNIDKIINYHAIIEPSIDEEDTKTLTNRIKAYLSSTDDTLYFNRNEEVKSSTRKGFILGILFYYLIGFILIISDIYCYKKKIN